MLRALRVGFLYIGTVIGAGFASGREIALFFGDSSPLTVALAALFMAVPATLFLAAGKFGVMPGGTAVRTGVVIAAFSSCAAMLAGLDLSFGVMTGVGALAVLAAVAAGALVVLGTEKIKLASSLLIPLLLVLLVVIYLKSGAPLHGGTFSLKKPVHYAGLDVLMGGMVISREGEKLTGKQAAITVVFSSLFLGGVLFLLQNIVLCDDLNSSMPVLAIADKVGLKAAAALLIAIAIFTTLVASLDVFTDTARKCFADFAIGRAARAKTSPLCRFARFYSAPRNRAFAVGLNLLVLYPVSFFGFENIVDSVYPFIGLCGLAMTVAVAYKLLFRGVLPRLRTHSRRRKKAGETPLRKTPAAQKTA